MKMLPYPTQKQVGEISGDLLVLPQSKLDQIQNPIAEMGKEMMIISLALMFLTLFIFDINLVSSSSSSIRFRQGELLLLQGGGGGGGDCSGEKVGEWSAAEREMEMDSEMNRRVLWGGSGVGSEKRYISYDALRRDNVPCDRPGIPYYNCRALPKANPYTRGCSVITGCARGD